MNLQSYDFVEGFVPMRYSNGYYEVRLRGGVRVPRSAYARLCRTDRYVACWYRYRDYDFNRPTCFIVPERDSDGREYILSWGGFCVWADDPERVYRVYGCEGNTLYLRYGSGYYRSCGFRPPVACSRRPFRT